MQAKAPDSWEVSVDAGPRVRMTRGSMAIEIQGPIIGRITIDGRYFNYPPVPAEGYAYWLRDWSPAVLEDRTITVDGKQVPQITREIQEDRWMLGEVAGMAGSDFGPWPILHEGDVVTVTVIEVKGKTMLVASYGAENDTERAHLQAATELVLSTLKLP